jgi:protein-disulfide isomerase
VFRLSGSKAFWKFHELAFQNQRALTTENFEAWAVEAGVDKAKFKAVLRRKSSREDRRRHAGARASGVTGTPASFINGVFLSRRAAASRSSRRSSTSSSRPPGEDGRGVKGDKVYVELSKENKAKNPAPKARDEKKPDAPAQDDKTVWKVPVGESPVKGKADALVTVVIFSDFQCPFCTKVEPTFEEVEKTYGDKVRFVWKDKPLPFHPRAEPAAELAVRPARRRATRASGPLTTCSSRTSRSSPTRISSATRRSSGSTSTR